MSRENIQHHRLDNNRGGFAEKLDQVPGLKRLIAAITVVLGVGNQSLFREQELRHTRAPLEQVDHADPNKLHDILVHKLSQGALQVEVTPETVDLNILDDSGVAASADNLQAVDIMVPDIQEFITIPMIYGERNYSHVDNNSTFAEEWPKIKEEIDSLVDRFFRDYTQVDLASLITHINVLTFGFSSFEGKTEPNMVLSQRRAKFVRDYFVILCAEKLRLIDTKGQTYSELSDLLEEYYSTGKKSKKLEVYLDKANASGLFYTPTEGMGEKNTDEWKNFVDQAWFEYLYNLADGRVEHYLRNISQTDESTLDFRERSFKASLNTEEKVDRFIGIMRDYSKSGTFPEKTPQLWKGIIQLIRIDSLDFLFDNDRLATLKIDIEFKLIHVTATAEDIVPFNDFAEAQEHFSDQPEPGSIPKPSTAPKYPVRNNLYRDFPVTPLSSQTRNPRNIQHAVGISNAPHGIGRGHHQTSRRSNKQSAERAGHRAKISNKT